jgi:predicted metalloenzyme YecM
MEDINWDEIDLNDEKEILKTLKEFNKRIKKLEKKLNIELNKTGG